jgi:hypothetical protein
MVGAVTKLLTTVETALSVERLAPYRREVSNDLSAAIALYRWNADISTAFWKDIGQLEVLVRNALHHRLTVWSTREYDEPRWYLDPSGVFSEQSVADITKARCRVRQVHKPELPGRVIAELPFGFWRFLIAKRYEASLWIPTLWHVFPHLMGRGSREDLHQQLIKLHGLCNRLAHQEPVHNRPLVVLHDAIVTVTEWINPVFRGWIEQQSAVHPTLATRPKQQG